MTNNLKCKICGRNCKNFGSIATHVMRSHNISVKEYYDRFMKSPNEGICKSCQKQTEFKTLTKGYRTTCSQKCSRQLMSSVEARTKARQTLMKKYGVENAGSLDWVKKKISVAHIQRLSDPKEREKISTATKAAMQRPDVRQKFLSAIKQPKSDETRKKLSDSAKQRFINDPHLKEKLYTVERNKKISESKKEYWKTHPEERKRIMDIWKKRSETKLETKMYNFLSTSNIQFQKRYEIEQRQYDAYLPDHNILLEFDGEFWHKKTLEECKYSFQIFNFYNDRHKDEIAKKYGIPLFRIRENDPPEKILEHIK